jgi:hypothetical protein
MGYYTEFDISNNTQAVQQAIEAKSQYTTEIQNESYNS